MDSNMIVDNMISKYGFNDYSSEYRDTLCYVIDLLLELFGNNLLSITLGGSGGKNKIISGWSDLDIYVILKKYNIEQVRMLQDSVSDLDIHIGFTFYDLYEVENNLIDFKTKIMIYEKNNYNVNPTLYGDDYFNDVSYSEVYNNDMANYPVVLQAFKRMYIEILNDKRKIDKSYIKKMLVLLKCILSSYRIFAFGYDEVFSKIVKMLYNDDVKINLSDLIINLEENEEYILDISMRIIEYVSEYELFRNYNNECKKRLLVC